MNPTLYKALEWLIANPLSSVRQIAAGIGERDDRRVFKALDDAAYNGLCQCQRIGSGPWLWEVPEGAPLAEHGAPGLAAKGGRP